MLGDSTTIDTFAQYKQTEEEKFFEFVNTNIDKLTSYTQMKGKELKFSEVNDFLMSYQHVRLTLIGLSTFTQNELDKEQEAFDEWYADRYILIRARENRSDLAAQKWLSGKEIEMMVRHENKVEYIEKKANLTVLLRKVEFIHKMERSWESQQFILSTLSNNIQSEVSINFKSN